MFLSKALTKEDPVDFIIQNVLNALQWGSFYALIALGYTMVYGIIELINFAHGEIYMIGAFTALIIGGVLQITTALNPVLILIISLAAAVFFSAGYGVTMEKIAYKPLRHAPRLSALISAIGMSMFLQNYVLLAQTSDFLPFPHVSLVYEDGLHCCHERKATSHSFFASTFSL